MLIRRARNTATRSTHINNFDRIVACSLVELYMGFRRTSTSAPHFQPRGLKLDQAERTKNGPASRDGYSGQVRDIFGMGLADFNVFLGGLRGACSGQNLEVWLLILTESLLG